MNICRPTSMEDLAGRRLIFCAGENFLSLLPACFLRADL